jgi:hypothetical protein
MALDIGYAINPQAYYVCYLLYSRLVGLLEFWSFYQSLRIFLPLFIHICTHT